MTTLEDIQKYLNLCNFACKHILNIELSPSQSLLLCKVWNHKFPMLVSSNSTDKSFILSVYTLLRALLMPSRKIVIAGAGFRQSKVFCEHIDTIWKNATVLQDLCDNNSGKRCSIDRCVMRIGQSTITCLPLGDGQNIRGQRADDIILLEFDSIPRDIFENIAAGFASNLSNKSNQIILSTTEVPFGFDYSNCSVIRIPESDGTGYL